MKIFKVFLLSLLLIIINQLFAFLIALMVFYKDDSKNLMFSFLISAIPMGALTYLFARILKLKTLKEVILSSSIWTILLLTFYILIGIGNNTFSIIFSRSTFYLMLICTFFGPLLPFKITKK